MDKDRKIQRYRRKDYTQLVSFPVEIVGRDGVVRNYSFEESIRLYQRRIASADLRYRDQEVITAEKQHCLNRIDQLRKSFFAHYGWAGIQLVDDASMSEHALSAEVAAFLRRCLNSVHAQMEQFAISHIQTSEHYRVYFVQPPNLGNPIERSPKGHFLLYVFQLQTEGACPNRESFFGLIKLLQSLKLTKQGSTENLIAFFHTHDCGLILTGHGDLPAVLDSTEEIEDIGLAWPDESPPDPVSTAMRRLSQGRFDEAQALFVEAYKEHHFRRVAYLGAAVVADQQGDDLEAEIATVMGCSYFPGDPALVYHKAVNLLRKGHFSSARVALDTVDSWSNGGGAAHLVHALSHLAEGDDENGVAHLRKAQQAGFKLDPHLDRVMRWTQSQLGARRILVSVAWVFAVGFGVTAWHLSSVVYFGGSLFFAMLTRAIFKTWKRQLLRRIHGPTATRLRLSSTSLLLADAQQEDLQ